MPASGLDGARVADLHAPSPLSRSYVMYLVFQLYTHQEVFDEEEEDEESLAGGSQAGAAKEPELPVLSVTGAVSKGLFCLILHLPAPLGLGSFLGLVWHLLGWILRR